MTLVLPIATYINPSPGFSTGIDSLLDTGEIGLEWAASTHPVTNNEETDRESNKAHNYTGSERSVYTSDECRPIHAGIKRKLKLSREEQEEENDFIPPARTRRISPLDNTPKQRRDEKKKIYKMSVQKLRQIDDPEKVLHRAVLINNTMKRMQKEIRDEKKWREMDYDTYNDIYSRKRSWARDFHQPEDSFLTSITEEYNKTILSSTSTTRSAACDNECVDVVNNNDWDKQIIDCVNGSESQEKIIDDKCIAHTETPQCPTDHTDGTKLPRDNTDKRSVSLTFDSNAIWNNISGSIGATQVTPPNDANSTDLDVLSCNYMPLKHSTMASAESFSDKQIYSEMEAVLKSLVQALEGT
ncbi:uncharacterized protein LOC106158847 [Lingula anatina]|uniref:Uncharacterized protein LOC106158847 n=1 Tax=Lingula anatina TaxID=7574 RepID=A0A1S3HWJ2_LINAN|nr:uncharacterized protein LOC106158847 [Lingula anatina]XP_013390410.1 uncharacterized protein LOC106158847 [Lingula anatina]XP_013390411.1 uncharacterized protein LOC106158847 [Lingula anatina]XP_013390412.1 uncharacterized protein LOC106158847 [Lingula anatina]XP_013390413.1 uncharacterized protein LOC106158847 [Lingula anatina]|eukprot:XP_013390409.1 uncharacterized protein LOC106158847 [Lingula anatina]